MRKLNCYLLLSFLALMLYVPGISSIPTIDRDEAHFAQATRQMLQTGEYFKIRFQEKTRFQKPPGINWLQALSVKLLSKPDTRAIWPYRIPSVLGALLSVLFLYFFARRFVSESAAKLAAALLASSLLLVFEAHMAVIDSSLLFSVLLMQGALWHIYQAGMDKKEISWGWALCFWLALAYGFVLKGVTPLVAVLSIASLCLIEKRVDWLAGLRPLRGLALFFLLSLAWLFMVNMAENSNYLLQMLNKDLLPKLKGGHESHGKPPLFHLAILPLTFWPASLFLWQGAAYAFSQRRERVVKFLLAWILPTWLFFELMPTKLPQYVLPTFPALALLCALAVEAGAKDKLRGKWLGFLQITWAILSIGLALALASLPYLVMQQITTLSIVFFTLLSSLTCLTTYFAWQGAYKRACLGVLLMALVAYPLTFAGILPQLKPVWLTSNLVELIDKTKLSKEKPLLVVGFEEPSLVFNLNTKLVKFIDPQAAESILGSDPENLAVVDSRTFDTWAKEPLKLQILAHTRGYNYSKGRWLELLVVGQQK